jgi:periplasmic divalent cation tolerance protein
MATEFVQLTTTAGSREEADRLATALLEPRLAACVQVVGPIESRYWWHGTLERSEEWLLLAKTAAALLERATAAVVAAHSYDVPEVTATPIVAGHPPYLEWISASARPSDVG